MAFNVHTLSTYAPKSLQHYAYQVLNKLHETLSHADLDELNTLLDKKPDLATHCVRALIGSDYILESCCRHSELLTQWLLSSASTSPLTGERIIHAVATTTSKTTVVSELNAQLRYLRRRFMVALYWRDLNGLADFSEVSKTMTVMAETFIQNALDFHYRVLCEKHGTPLGKNSQQAQPMLVIGMGKLGGGELNVSSDIDLMFAFPEAGQTNHKSRPIDNQQFFTLLGQQLIKTLNDTTADGFVFRVDMRLRPYGQSGALVNNFASLDHYYQTQGRDWERFAAIKARVIACTAINDPITTQPIKNQPIKTQSRTAATSQLYKIFQPFVYRKYIDFSTVESLRQLKTMIVQEVRRKGLEDDIKLGSGGIREIEFIAQSFQLIRGGKDTRLQERHLLTTLQQLYELNNLDEDVVDALKDAYLFLRKTEHSIQAMQDMQTQKLPIDTLQKNILAWVVGYSHWDTFYQQLDYHRQFVSSTFQQLIADPSDKHINYYTALPEWQLFWETPTSADLTCLKADYRQTIVEQINHFKQSRNVTSLSSVARQKLDLFMPQLFQVISQSSGCEQAVIRILQWLETIVTRTNYLLLLLENPHIIKHLIKLFAASSWVAETLTQIPALLDELLYPETLFSLPEKDQLRDELRQRLLRIDPNDIEAYMETLRYFRLAHNLHVAACEISGSLPLMKVSDYLTHTAEVILEQVLQLSWHILTARYGFPKNAFPKDAFPKNSYLKDSASENPDNQSTGFLVVGYGKLGGIEMSYSSDLDLVFIYNASTQGMTDGEKPLDNQTFYTRLGQKIIHILSARTISGQLYDVDMRLRPSGNSGLLVSSLSAFERYQQQDAWTWEHQALVRARPVAGDKSLATKFVELRKQILQKPKNINILRNDVLDMREKMKSHLDNNTYTSKKKHMPKKQIKTNQFHLKKDAGGIIDIEFIVQYAVLAWSQKQPAICEWTDNIRILESLQDSSLIAPEQANQLIKIYQIYRKHIHRLALQQKTSFVVERRCEDSGVHEDKCFRHEREQVKTLWEMLLLKL